MNPIVRRKRLDRIAKRLNREDIWGVEQLLAFLDNGISDILCLRRKYGYTSN